MHNLTRHQSFIHDCSECGTAFDKASEVAIHVEDIHKKTGRYCRVCGASANSDDVNVEVGRVWLELPSPIILLNQIQAVLGNPIQLGL